MLVRNFSIIAHIDHGKTTLTDRLLLKTGTITARDFTERVMDSNPIEQERGITIKLAPVRMNYTLPEHLRQQFGTPMCQLNLIDTPGHVDFTYEVSRSLAAGEGAVLLVDASQGVQAQTLSNFQKARDEALTIIPVLNKIDLPSVDVDAAKLEMMELFGFDETQIVLVSAKTGEGVDLLLEQLVTQLPQPPQAIDEPLRALVFSSQYHQHKGVVVYVRVVDGKLTVGQLEFMRTGVAFEPQEVGIFSPTMQPVAAIEAGSVGYIATGLKDIRKAQVGDTITATLLRSSTPLKGYNPPQLMVYMDFYPVDGGDYQDLVDAMDKLRFNDAALQYSPTNSPALGNGLRVGFLGVLHAEIVQERLEREYGLELIATSPSVRYEVKLTNGEEILVHNPAELPEPNLISQIREPVAKVRLLSPQAYLGAVLQLCEAHRGVQHDIEYFGDRVQLTYHIPLPELIVTFHDELKSVSSGFASLEYEVTGYQTVEAVRLIILVNKVPVDALSQIVVKEKAEEQGKFMVKRLKEVIPRQLFEIPVQAAIGGKVIARETVKAFRKDVTAKLYGGDRTRRMKLLEKQKKGKERRKQFGQVEIPQEAFMAVLKRD
jgi:GTP-binding protein LepA